MTAPPLLAIAALVTAGALLTPAARAEAWPGDRVAAPVRGEVKPDDRVDDTDGVYGRLDGDLTLSGGLGAEFADGTRAAALLRALFYHSGGLVLGYSDSLGRELEPRRTLFGGIELRPLFLPRWALDLEFNHALADLMLDSLSIGAGAHASGGGPRGARAGFEFSLGMGIPLFARAQGPWLEARGFLRPAREDGEAGVIVALSWYGSLTTPLVK
jgi:hypothetical protein